jgi:hypothetical protein
MRFEELQAIWETQADKPLFSINEFGLHMALHQQRERARRRLFWRVYVPSYVTSLYMLAASAFVCVGFYFKDTSERDFAMGVGDWLASLGAAGAFVFAAVSMWRSRRKHERAQDAVAPSLRQEIERGIAQLKFEVHAGTSPEAWRNAVLICVGGMLFVWEVGRFNGDPTPWPMLLFAGAVSGVALFFGWVWAKGLRADRERRTRALEDLRAKLDETSK